MLWSLVKLQHFPGDRPESCDVPGVVRVGEWLVMRCHKGLLNECLMNNKWLLLMSRLIVILHDDAWHAILAFFWVINSDGGR